VLDILIYFNLTSIKLSLSHDLSHEFCELAVLNWYFLINFFLNFIIQYWVCWNWTSWLFYDLLYMRSSWSGVRVLWVSQVGSAFFLRKKLNIFIQFYYSTLGWFETRLYNFFFYGIIPDSWFKFDRLAQVNSNHFF